MGFNDIELRRTDKMVGGFCRDRIPDDLRSQLKLFHLIRGNAIVFGSYFGRAIGVSVRGQEYRKQAGLRKEP